MPFGMLLRSPGRGVVCRDGGVWAEIIFMYLPLSIEIDSCITAKACHYFHAIFFAKLDLTLTVLSLSLRTSLHRSFPSPPLSSSASQPQPQLSVSFYFFYLFVYSFICHHMGRQPQTPLFHLVHFHQSFGISSLLIQLTVVLSKVLHLVLTYYSGSNHLQTLIRRYRLSFSLSIYHTLYFSHHISTKIFFLYTSAYRSLSYSILFPSYFYLYSLSLHLYLSLYISTHFCKISLSFCFSLLPMSICNPSKVCESYFTTHIEYFTHIAAIPGIKSACVREKCSERERGERERGQGGYAACWVKIRLGIKQKSANMVR